MGSLQGRRAIVTGGASGIGRATVEALAREGARVLIADVDLTAAGEFAAAMRAKGRDVDAVACDVASDEDCRRAVETAAARFGGIDILVNSAGIIRRADVVALLEQDWDRVMAVNVKSVYLMARHTVPIMAAGGGRWARSSTWAPAGASWAVPTPSPTARRRVPS